MVRDLIVNCLFYRDRWAFSCGQARLLTKEKFLCSDAEHKSYRKCWQEKIYQIFSSWILNKCLYICHCTIWCKKEACHSPWNCAQKGSMSHIFFLVSLSHWKLVLFVDWKLRLVAAVESVIHRIPKKSSQSELRQLLHTWVIPLCLKRCSFRDQGPIGTFFTFWVPIGSLYIVQGPYFQFTFANICFGSLFLLPRVSILSLLGPCCRDLSSLSILCFLWPP